MRAVLPATKAEKNIERKIFPRYLLVYFLYRLNNNSKFVILNNFAQNNRYCCHQSQKVITFKNIQTLSLIIFIKSKNLEKK